MSLSVCLSDSYIHQPRGTLLKASFQSKKRGFQHELDEHYWMLSTDIYQSNKRYSAQQSQP